MSPTNRPNESIAFVALLGAGDGEVVTLAELHRNPRVHIAGVYDPDPNAVGHELSEILGLMHGSDPSFLDHIAATGTVILPRDIHRYSGSIRQLREAGCRLINQAEALMDFAADRVVEHPPVSPAPDFEADSADALETSLHWLEVALERESFLRSLLSIAVQAVGADKGSVQLFDPFTQQLYIAYADGLSDHTVRSSRQCLGEGIAGRVAQTRRAELLRGHDLALERRDRPDIESAICSPLESEGDLLGVINVSTDSGSSPLDKNALGRLVHLSSRIATGLRRLLEVQAVLDQAVTEGIERGIDGLLQDSEPTLGALVSVRDLVGSMSGATRVALIVLGDDGPSLHLHAETDPAGGPIFGRDIHAHQGVLGQVLLDGSPVVLEERNRRAGEERVRREMTLYLPLGGQEAFAVLLMHFDSLGALSQFQRSMERVRDVLTPRVGALLSRHEIRERHMRLRQFAAGLGQLASAPDEERFGRAATLFMDLSGAEAVALWRAGSELPDTELRHTGRGHSRLDSVWTRLRERIRSGGPMRLRELDSSGSELRSVMLVGSPGGLALAALNRKSTDLLGELGFRDEDLEYAEILLQAVSGTGTGALSGVESPAGASTLASGIPTLERAVDHELARARRYHLGFSLSVFHFDLDGQVFGQCYPDLQALVSNASRDTDVIVWLADEQCLAVLAPEEMRGQRALVRRYTEELEEFFASELETPGRRVAVRSASYPRDGENTAELLERSLPAAD